MARLKRNGLHKSRCDSSLSNRLNISKTYQPRTAHDAAVATSDISQSNCRAFKFSNGGRYDRCCLTSDYRCLSQGPLELPPEILSAIRRRCYRAASQTIFSCAPRLASEGRPVGIFVPLSVVLRVQKCHHIFSFSPQISP